MDMMQEKLLLEQDMAELRQLINKINRRVRNLKKSKRLQSLGIEPETYEAQFIRAIESFGVATEAQLISPTKFAALSKTNKISLVQQISIYTTDKGPVAVIQQNVTKEMSAFEKLMGRPAESLEEVEDFWAFYHELEGTMEKTYEEDQSIMQMAKKLWERPEQDRQPYIDATLGVEMRRDAHVYTKYKRAVKDLNPTPKK